MDQDSDGILRYYDFEITIDKMCIRQDRKLNKDNEWKEFFKRFTQEYYSEKQNVQIDIHMFVKVLGMCVNDAPCGRTELCPLFDAIIVNAKQKRNCSI
jgi:hypothetical protein